MGGALALGCLLGGASAAAGSVQADVQEDAREAASRSDSVAIRGAGAQTREGVQELWDALAELEVELRVNRSYGDAWVQLLELWLDAAREGEYPAQGELLVRLAELRGEVALALGDLEAAERTLDHLYWDPLEPITVVGVETVPLTPARRATERSLLADSEVLTVLRRRVEQALGAEDAAEEVALAEDDPLVVEVLGLLDNGGAYDQHIRNMGVAALPALVQAARICLADPVAHPGTSFVGLILERSPIRAAAIANDCLDTGDPRWPYRIVETLNSNSWNLGRMGDRQRALVVQEWGQVVDRLLAQPGLDIAALDVAFELGAEGYESDIIVSVILRAWETGDLDLQNVVLEAVESRKDLEPFSELLQTLIEQGNGDLSALALEWCKERGPRVLYKYVDDGDVRRRLALAEVLHESFTRRVDVNLGQNHISEVDRRLVLELSDDADPEVRRLAATCARGSQEKSEFDDLFLRLAADPEVRIRQIVASTGMRSAELQARVLTLLAADEDREVLATVDRKLIRVYPPPFQVACLPVLRARLLHPTYSILQSLNPDERVNLYEHFDIVEGAEGILTEALLAHEDPRLIQFFEGALNSNAQWPDRLAQLPDELVGALALRLCSGAQALAPGRKYLRRLFPLDAGLSPARRDVLARIAGDPAMVPFARLRAMNLLMQVGDERGAAHVLATLSEVGAFGAQTHDVMRQELVLLRQALPPEVAEEVLFGALAEPRIPEGLLVHFLPRTQSSAPLARAILDRFEPQALKGNVYINSLVGAALRSLVDDPSPEDVPRVASQVKRDVDCRFEVHEAFSTASSPLWFELFDECLRAPWVIDEAQRLEVIAHAAIGLTNQLSDRAGEALLRAAREAASPKVRGFCMSGVETIRGFLEQEERFFRQKSRVLERGKAIEQLLIMLEDPETRIQIEALRGLGTLGAIDALPRVIHKLRSEEAAVRDAAREALEKLNRAPAEEKGQGDSEGE